MALFLPGFPLPFSRLQEHANSKNTHHYKIGLYTSPHHLDGLKDSKQAVVLPFSKSHSLLFLGSYGIRQNLDLLYGLLAEIARVFFTIVSIFTGILWCTVPEIFPSLTIFRSSALPPIASK